VLLVLTIAVQIRGKALGEDSEEFAQSLLELGDFYLQAGKFDVRRLPPVSLCLSLCLPGVFIRTYLCSDRMGLQEAESFITRAATMLRKSHPESVLTAHALNSVGMLRLRQVRHRSSFHSSCLSCLLISIRF
jgi:hypothetical protein